LNDLLHDLVRTGPWLAAVGKDDAEIRMRHEELALRFFAVRAAVANHRPPIKDVLNEFMRTNRSPDEARCNELAALFERALTNCAIVFETHAFRRLVRAKGRPGRWEANLNRAIFELQMLGLADFSAQLVREKADAIREAFTCHSLENPKRIWLAALHDEGLTSPLLERLPKAAAWDAPLRATRAAG
jgi:hypothetical protein